MLDRTEMDHFATIFVAYQKRGKAEDPDGEVSSQSRTYMRSLISVHCTRDRKVERATCAVDGTASTWTAAGTFRTWRLLCQVRSLTADSTHISETVIGKGARCIRYRWLRRDARGIDPTRRHDEDALWFP